MKQIIRLQFGLFLVVGSSLPLFADEPVEIPWNRICGEALGRQLTMTTSSGQTIEGYCIGIDINEMSLRTKDQNVVRVARASLSRLEMSRFKGNQLRTLGRGMRRALRYGGDALLSPAAPVGLAAVPVTLAWGAVSAPFCALGDLRDKINGKRVVKVI